MFEQSLYWYRVETQNNFSMRPLLVVSIGNPAPLTNTLHSAGHVLLNTLASYANAPRPNPNRRYANGLTSQAVVEDVMFWQSPSFMNVSGPAVASAWRSFCKDHPDANPHLVILHDELELNTGRYKVSTGRGRSARGHNGLKSIMAQRGFRELEFSRIGVGIGPRPVSRKGDDVARFVLGKIGSTERERIEGIAESVWREILRLRNS